MSQLLRQRFRWIRLLNGVFLVTAASALVSTLGRAHE